MDVQVEKLSPVLMELQIQVPADTVNKEVEAAYDELRRSARVRGFRKGKVPRQILVQLYGSAIHADVARKLVDRTLTKALSDKQVQPLTQPSVEPAELRPKQAFSFKARFEVRPDITKVTWEGLEAKRPKAEVSAEMVDAELERMRREHATNQPVEGRAAKKGDLVTLALRFAIDGKEENEEVDTEVGSGQILAAIDEALEGMSAGEKKEVSTSFSQNHPTAKVRGKATTFEVTVKELKERVLPEVDDDFAKDCEHESLAKMREVLSEQVKKRLDQQSEEDMARQLVAQLCDKNPIPVPPSLVEQQARITRQEIDMIARMGGQSPLGGGPELGERIRADSEMKVRAGLLMAEIAKDKGLKVTQEDLEKGYQELADQSGKNVAKIKADYRERQKHDMLVGMILEDKVLDLMESAAKISSE
jgi:trigger factor